MKRLFLSLFALFLMVGLLAVPVMASDGNMGYKIYYDDGSYAVVTNSNYSTRASTDAVKSYTYYNPQGQKCFAYVLFASFTYNGTAGKADSCNFAAEIYRQGWDMASHSEYVSGNTAYGNVTFTGPDGQVRTASLTLTCDKNGNVT